MQSLLVHEHRLAAGTSRGQPGQRCQQEAQQPLCQAAHRCACSCNTGHPCALHTRNGETVWCHDSAMAGNAFFSQIERLCLAYRWSLEVVWSC